VQPRRAAALRARFVAAADAGAPPGADAAAAAALLADGGALAQAAWGARMFLANAELRSAQAAAGVPVAALTAAAAAAAPPPCAADVASWRASRELAAFDADLLAALGTPAGAAAAAAFLEAATRDAQAREHTSPLFSFCTSTRAGADTRTAAHARRAGIRHLGRARLPQVRRRAHAALRSGVPPARPAVRG
jgi:hypothetical protein